MANNPQFPGHSRCDVRVTRSAVATLSSVSSDDAGRSGRGSTDWAADPIWGNGARSAFAVASIHASCSPVFDSGPAISGNQSNAMPVRPPGESATWRPFCCPWLLSRAAEALMPSWLSLTTSFTPRKPRRLRLRRNSVRNGSGSLGPTLTPGTSRWPSVLTPTATISATLTMRPTSLGFGPSPGAKPRPPVKGHVVRTKGSEHPGERHRPTAPSSCVAGASHAAQRPV